jgi:hypothetical protein
MWRSWYWKRDPGPCPVDDAPHTTCVPPEAGTIKSTTSATVIVPTARPSYLTPPVSFKSVILLPAAPPPPPDATFTTATYSRKVHGKKGAR